MIPTPDLDLRDTYPVSARDMDLFQRNGHVLLRGLASVSEIGYFRPHIREACRIHNPEKRRLEDRDTYGKAFLQTMNLWRTDDEIRKFVFARRFAQTAADLLGVRNVRLYHDQALFKEPRGGLTPWHQDMYYWPLDTDRTITMWMPLVDITRETGMLTFAEGSHRKGLVESLEISDVSEELYEKYVNKNGFPVVSAGFMKAGDATFHSGLTIHCAPANSSDETMREVMTVIYFADGARVTKPANEHQEADRVTWLGSRLPGELAASELNPVLN